MTEPSPQTPGLQKLTEPSPQTPGLQELPEPSAPATGHPERPSVLLAAGVTVLVWSSAFVGIRYAGKQFEPGPLALGRLLVGSLALGALVLIRREPMVPRRTIAGIVLCGVLWFGVYNVALNAAERYLDAGIAALLVNVGPIFIAILAGLLLKEGFPRLLLLGCVISFAGAALIGVATSKHAANAGWGAVLCIIAALGYAGGVVAQKPVLRHASPLAVTWLACTVGAIGCLPFAASFVHEAGRASTSSLLWTGYLGLFPTAVGFVTWAYALTHTSAGRMGSTTYLVPPLALLLGWVMLGEVPPLLTLPGGILCLAGVAIARWRPRSPRPAPASVAVPSRS
jgi:drug/metabolite transporter (DMT)-like permease